MDLGRLIAQLYKIINCAQPRIDQTKTDMCLAATGDIFWRWRILWVLPEDVFLRRENTLSYKLAMQIVEAHFNVWVGLSELRLVFDQHIDNNCAGLGRVRLNNKGIDG